MDDRMLAKQYDLARSTHEPLAVFRASLALNGRIPQCKLLNSLVDCSGDSHEIVRGNCDGSGLHQSMSEIIKEILRVFNTNTQTDQILREASLGTCRGINGGMPVKGIDT